MAYIRLLFIPFLFLSIYSFPALSDKEEVPLNTVKRTRTSFDAKHMGEGKHDVEMDHKAVLGLNLYSLILGKKYLFRARY